MPHKILIVEDNENNRSLFRRKMPLECGLELINKPILPALLLKKIRSLLEKGER